MRLLASFVVMFALLALPVRAQSLIRDADIEHALAQLARPILQAAGLSPAQVKILLIDSRIPNAFVIDSRAIFIHTGMITRLKSAEALQSVIAHEAAHIANGHISRRLSQLGTRNNITGLGIALAAAVAASGAKGSGAIALGVASSAQRNLLSHSRAEESSADQSAVRYLAASGISTRGAIEVHDIFKGQDVLSQSRQDPYARSHPFTRNRVRAMEAYVNAYGGDIPFSDTSRYWFERAKGKIWGFQQAPKSTLRRAKQMPTGDIKLMMEAIAYHRRAQTSKAAGVLQKLLKSRPNDAYYHELMGQVLLEGRQYKAAVNAYGRAAKLAPKNTLILAGYGRALLAAGQAKSAVEVLERARSRDFRDPGALRDLGNAYAKTGRPAMASLLVAERYALRGRFQDAALHAERAAGRLPRGSGPWQRAQDVLSAAQRQK
ncbi:MAG: M48 family metalloprotease [Planktotalea sp.]|uniref:M48 family metalloprotease n=1 Tax=Planktotalea sp. TaxID=2029877 RepID=UPI00261EB175|nr:M48 family metalloprotease [Planktotalea sp.]MDG1078141.1 M48 family metalloprotease [Planktotalea sp.]